MVIGKNNVMHNGRIDFKVVVHQRISQANHFAPGHRPADDAFLSQPVKGR